MAIPSLRVEGTWMIIGQSSDIAAARLAEGTASAQDLDDATLRPRLLAAGQVPDLDD